MNLTVLSLHATSFSLSPFFTHTKDDKVIFKRTLASRFFSSFYFSNKARKILVDRCTFKNISNSAILISKSGPNNEVKRNNGFKYSGGHFVIVKDSAFISCHAETNGGAVNIGYPLVEYPVLNIMNTAFVSCSAKLGGALYVSARDIIIGKSCFANCYATERYNVGLVDNECKQCAFISQVSISKCPGIVNIVQQTLSVTKEMLRFMGNFSKNNNGCSGVLITNNQLSRVFIAHSLFSNNKGTSGFIFQQTASILFDHVLIFDNSIDEPFACSSSHKGLYVHLANSSVVNNNFTVNVNSSKLNAYFEIEQTLIDNDMINMLKARSSLFKLTEANELNLSTPFFYLKEECINPIIRTKTPNKVYNTKKTIIILLLAASFASVFVVVAILYIGSTRKANEDQWITMNENLLK